MTHSSIRNKGLIAFTLSFIAFDVRRPTQSRYAGQVGCAGFVVLWLPGLPKVPSTSVTREGTPIDLRPARLKASFFRRLPI